jgi:hypothetical protein
MKALGRARYLPAITWLLNQLALSQDVYWAIEPIGLIGSEEAITPLKIAYSDEDNTNKERILQALLAIGTDNAYDAFYELVHVSDQSDEVMLKALCNPFVIDDLVEYDKTGDIFHQQLGCFVVEKARQTGLEPNIQVGLRDNYVRALARFSIQESIEYLKDIASWRPPAPDNEESDLKSLKWYASDEARYRLAQMSISPYVEEKVCSEIDDFCNSQRFSDFPYQLKNWPNKIVRTELLKYCTEDNVSAHALRALSFFAQPIDHALFEKFADHQETGIADEARRYLRRC